MSTTLNVSILNRNDSKTNWDTINPKLNNGEIGIDTINKDFKIGDNTNNWKDLPYYLYGKPTNIRFYVTGQGSTSAQGSGTTQRAILRGTIAEPITNIANGMMISYKLDVTGSETYGTVLELKDSSGNILLDSIESTTSTTKGQHPIVYNVSSGIGTRYSVSSIINMVYDETATATAYIDGKSTSIKGCWKIMDYNSNDANYQLRECYARFFPGNVIKNYAFCVVNKNTIYAINTSPAVSTNKTSGFYTGEFDPFKLIYFLNISSTIASAASTTTPLNTAALYYKYHLADLRYCFNGISSSSSSSKFKQGDSVYLVATPSDNGANTAKLYYGSTGTDYSACLTNTLPTSMDNLIYIYLGQMYDSYRLELHCNHPIYWYRWGQIRIYEGTIINANALQSSYINLSPNDGSNENLFVIDANNDYISSSISKVTLNHQKFKNGLLHTNDAGELDTVTINGGSGSLTSNSTSDNGIGYIDNITYTSATSSGGGTVTISNGSASLSSEYDSTNKNLKIILNYTPQTLGGATTFVTGVTPGQITVSKKYLHHTHIGASINASKIN